MRSAAAASITTAASSRAAPPLLADVADVAFVPPLRVFLSHTSDLGRPDERGSFVGFAAAAVRRAGHAVTHMSDFGARPTSPAATCIDMVRRCDVYVGIIGLRYGSPVPDRPDVSYTELEFEAAGQRGLPRLIFLIREDSDRLPGAGQAAEYRARQILFRHRLLESGLTIEEHVGTPDELDIAIYHALVQLVSPPSPAPDAVPPVAVAAPGRPARLLTQWLLLVPLAVLVAMVVVSGSMELSSLARGAVIGLMPASPSPPSAGPSPTPNSTPAAASPSPASPAPARPSGPPPPGCQQADAAINRYNETVGLTWYSKEQAAARAENDLYAAWMTALHSGASSAVVSDLGALTQDFSQMAEYAADGEETGAYDDALAQTKVNIPMLQADCRTG